MSTGMVTTAIALVAVIVSIFGYFQKRASDRRDTEARLNTLLQNLQDALARQTYSMEILGLAAQADEICKKNKALDPGWSGFMVLAIAFAQIWDTKRADIYWDKVVQRAWVPHSRHIVLQSRASYRYNIGRQADIEGARADFAEALALLDSHAQGVDLATEQRVNALLQQAACEGSIGNQQIAIDLANLAWTSSQEIQAVWRRNRAGLNIAGKALVLQLPQEQLHAPREWFKQLQEQAASQYQSAADPRPFTSEMPPIPPFAPGPTYTVESTPTPPPTGRDALA